MHASETDQCNATHTLPFHHLQKNSESHSLQQTMNHASPYLHPGRSVGLSVDTWIMLSSEPRYSRPAATDDGSHNERRRGGR
uniref:Uncharacterized protein n=1 Tax=Zea mays TaxID=4577 RepID=C4J018_MAIZE|nr:unknown [Zea mays]